jgi:hypothetical protein
MLRDVRSARDGRRVLCSNKGARRDLVQLYGLYRTQRAGTLPSFQNQWEVRRL